MNILGISAFYHDSAACLVRDGEILAAAQEERFTRKKHDEGFPKNAVEYCLKAGGIGARDLDYVVFYDKPLLKFERLLETYLSYAPAGYASFKLAMPQWLQKKLWMRDQILKELGFEGEIRFCEHHESHAASAFFPSPFKDAAVLTMDGVGEWATSSLAHGVDNRCEITREMRFPHSIGLLYSAFTYYTGFKVNSGEYKVMGLAPYGEPKYVDKIFNDVVDLKDDGSFKLNMDLFNYCQGLTMTGPKFHELFGGEPRTAETRLTQREMDLARSVQDAVEEIMLRMARYARKETGSKNLCLAGGVALNCVGNGKILRERVFDDLWIQPAAGDAGGALGAALHLWHHVLGNERKPAAGRMDAQKGSYLGPEWSDDEIAAYLEEQGIPHRRLEPAALPAEVARLVDEKNVIGWFHGRMEFGPRALCARSIIGDARDPEMQHKMNVKIKFRESFRPFAPVVLREDVGEYFDIDYDSPYMLLVAPVREERRKALSADEAKLFGIDKLNVPRSDIPAITHVDYSARLQTVHEETNPVFHKVLTEFKKRTGYSVMINTSFNVRGEPIVCTPADAYRCFMRTNMDVLVLGNFVLEKTAQPEWGERKEEWQKEFALD